MTNGVQMSYRERVIKWLTCASYGWIAHIRSTSVNRAAAVPWTATADFIRRMTSDGGTEKYRAICSGFSPRSDSATSDARSTGQLTPSMNDLVSSLSRWRCNIENVTQIMPHLYSLATGLDSQPCSSRRREPCRVAAGRHRQICDAPLDRCRVNAC